MQEHKLVKRKRPKETHGTSYRIEVGCGHLYLTVARDEIDLIEIFATLGRSGGCAMSQLEALTRSISLGFKYGIPVKEYIKQLEFIRCPSPAREANPIVDGKSSGSTEILSCADAIAKVLTKEIEKEKK